MSRILIGKRGYEITQDLVLASLSNATETNSAQWSQGKQLTVATVAGISQKTSPM